MLSGTALLLAASGDYPSNAFVVKGPTLTLNGADFRRMAQPHAKPVGEDERSAASVETVAMDASADETVDEGAIVVDNDVLSEDAVEDKTMKLPSKEKSLRESSVDSTASTCSTSAASIDDDGGANGSGTKESSSEPELAMMPEPATMAASEPTLAEWLKQGPYVLSLAPGFFGFYAHTGALIALEDAGVLDGVSFATGASAGALVAGLYASGLSPNEMGKTVVKFRRSDFWDPIGIGGLLRGSKFERIIEKTLPEGVKTFDQCRIPLAVSAFDVSRLTSRNIGEGRIAPALRASCTFPVLFSPVWHPRGVLIDGGVQDTTGTRCVPTAREDCRRVLNVTFGAKDASTCVPPSRVKASSSTVPAPDRALEVVSLAMEGLPRPHPFAMARGAEAMKAARKQVAEVLELPLNRGYEDLHWIAPTTSSKPPTEPRDAGVDNEDTKTVGGKRNNAKISTAAPDLQEDTEGSAQEGSTEVILEVKRKKSSPDSGSLPKVEDAGAEIEQNDDLGAAVVETSSTSDVGADGVDSE